MTRILLTAPTTFYAGVGGSSGNTGLSEAQALPTIQDVLFLLQQSYDLGWHAVEIHLLDGSIDPGFRMSGSMIGQRGITGLLVRQSSMAGSEIRPWNPDGGACAIALDSGAMLSIAECKLNGTVQAAAGRPQDLVMMGQASHLAIYGNNIVMQNGQYNGFTLVQSSTLDIQPQSWGSNTQNGGHLYWQGVYQDGFQTDQGSNIQANCNGVHGLISFHFQGSSVRNKPYWGVAFADIASGVAVLSGIDMHGTADGYKYRIRKGGTLDLNLIQDPLILTQWPGSAEFDGHFPVQGNGYLI